jgi:hypothetical protein
MKRLLSDKRFLKVANKAREYYLSNNQGASLLDIGLISNKTRNSDKVIRIRSSKNIFNKFNRRINVKTKVFNQKKHVQFNGETYIFKTFVKFYNEL